MTRSKTLTRGLTNIYTRCSLKVLWWVHAPPDHFRTSCMSNAVHEQICTTLLFSKVRFWHLFHSYQCFSVAIIKCCPSPQGCRQSCSWRPPDTGGEIEFRCAGGGGDQVKAGLRWCFLYWLKGVNLFKMAERRHGSVWWLILKVIDVCSVEILFIMKLSVLDSRRLVQREGAQHI